MECFYRNIIPRKTPVAIFRNGLIISMKPNKTIRIPNYDPAKHGNPVSFFLFGYPNLMALAIHRNIFERFHFDPRFKLFDDAHFVVRALLKYPFYQADQYTCVYVYHPQSRSVTYFQEQGKLQNMFDCIDDLFEHHNQDIISHTHKNIKVELIASVILVQANKKIANKQYLHALKMTMQALRLNHSLRNVRHALLTWTRLIYRFIFKH